MDNQRNLIIAVVLCGLLIIGWDAAINRFYPQPTEPIEAVEAAEQAGVGATAATPGAATPPSSGSSQPHPHHFKN